MRDKHKEYKLVILEGIDGVGKETQTKLLVESLKKDGYTVKHLTFPNYNSEFGKMISDYLKKNKEYDVKTLSTLYALDRINTFENESFNNYDYVVCDRYTPSNAAYSSSLVPMNERVKFASEIVKFEHEFLGLPYPDCTIVLDAEPSIVKEQIVKRGSKEDRNESDDAFQNIVRAMYKTLSPFYNDRTDQRYHIVDCMGNPERIKEIHVIQKKIYILAVRLMKGNLGI